MPLLNLAVSWLDRSAREGRIASVVQRVKLVRALQLSFAHMGVGAALFAVMWSTGWVDAPHPGASIPFWKRAFDAGKPLAGQNLVKLVGTRAAELYTLASQRGWPGAALGRVRLASRLPLSAPEAAALATQLESGCNAGHAESCWAVVAVVPARGGARADAMRLRDLTDRFCKGGVARACDALR